MNKKILLVGVVLLVIVVGVGSFYGGMIYAKKPNKGLVGRNFNGQMGANIAGMGQRGDRAGGTNGFISGEVISQDDQSITVKLKDTGTKIVFFSTSTQVIKTSESSLADIKIGQNLTITGKANSDGSLVAQSIIIHR